MNAKPGSHRGRGDKFRWKQTELGFCQPFQLYFQSPDQSKKLKLKCIPVKQHCDWRVELGGGTGTHPTPLDKEMSLISSFKKYKIKKPVPKRNFWLLKWTNIVQKVFNFFFYLWNEINRILNQGKATGMSNPVTERLLNRAWGVCTLHNALSVRGNTIFVTGSPLRRCSFPEPFLKAALSCPASCATTGIVKWDNLGGSGLNPDVLGLLASA